MNKNAIQKYAVWARNELIEQIKQRAFQYGITENGYGDENANVVAGRVLSPDEKRQRHSFVEEIKKSGYKQAVEEVAYTWFNRFVALRYMEVNDFLPSHIRVLSDASGNFTPEILANVLHLDLLGLDKAKVSELLNANASEELYRYLLLTQCNALNEALPEMFEKLGSYTEMLLPNNILKPDSVLGRLVMDIPEEDWKDAVQIIGWLYQYYWGDLRDILNKKNMVEKNELPAKTQFFTPDWICRYMVENSLGRLWYEGHRDFDKYQWKYYLDEAEQEPEVEQQLQIFRAEYETIKPEEIKLIDPCMGSGHILVYAFDVLMQIYTSVGWSERDAAKSIIENNLYGLDIDDRAGQLAYFAVMMKARKYNRRILNGDVTPNVLSIQESNWMTDDFIAYVADKDTNVKEDLVLLRMSFKDAKEYGSILNVPRLHYDTLFERFDIISRSYIGNLFEAQYQLMVAEQLLPLVKISQTMSQTYHVIVTNPPYLGIKKYNPILSEYINKHYSEYKYDLFSCIVSRSVFMLKPNSFASFITQQTWLNVDSFEKFRKNIINSTRLLQMVHLGSSTMEGGLGTTTFVFSNSKLPNYITLFSNLTKEDVEDKENLLSKKDLQTGRIIDSFQNLPKSVFSYSLSNRVLNLFENEPIVSQTKEPRSGLVTRNNPRFLRNWFEVKITDIDFNCNKKDYSRKWYPHVKGGGYRKWYGNYDFVVNWKDNGAEIREATKDANGGSVVSEECYFEEGLSWSLSTFSAKISLRYLPKGFIFNVEAPAVFNVPNSLYMLGFLNSKVGLLFLDIISDDVHYKTKDVGSTPFIQSPQWSDHINLLVNNNIGISKSDWDAFELSWDFNKHPLICENHTTDEAYHRWEIESKARFNQLKANEEELNQIFIDIYGLSDELTPEVEDKDITVRRADLGREIRSLISYAVGCMFGRYSLDVEGLAYAGGEWDAGKYKTFPTDNDNIIPICDDEYFDGDITGRFVDFVKTAYGSDTLLENLKFIADALGGRGTPREVIRNYFLNDFYKDHCKIYQKRPIYWLFDSGKKNGFKALIYMHRYSRDLLARMRTDYVHEQQERYRTQLSHIAGALNTATGAERARLLKQQDKLSEQAREIGAYEEKVHHLADMNITIDLDDGVKKNYEIFADVLAKI